MRNLAAALMLLFLFLPSQSFAADADGYTYCADASGGSACPGGGSGSRWLDSKQAAFDAYIDIYGTDTWCSGPNQEWPDYPTTQGANSLFNIEIGIRDQGSGCHQFPTEGKTFIHCHNAGGCTPPAAPQDPQVCAARAASGIRVGIDTDGPTLTDTYSLEGCEIRIEGVSICIPGDGCFAIGTYTGEAMEPPDGADVNIYPLDQQGVPTEEAPEGVTVKGENDSPQCVFANGQMVCGATTHPASCGTINGERACISVNDNSCVVLDSGAMSCFGTATLKDDTDTTVTADVQVERSDGAGGTVTQNYYSASTVNTVVNSGGTPDAEGGVTRAGESGDGSADGSVDGEGTLGEFDDSVECPDGGECGEADFSGLDDLSGEGSFLSGVSGISVGDMSGAGCPGSDTFTLWGEEFSFDYHCTFFATYGAMLRALFLLGWYLAALRVLLEA